jgi:hypothetical protein
MVVMRRRLAWLAAGLLMLGAWVLAAESGKNAGHDEAWIAGAMLGTLVIGILVVGLIRLAQQAPPLQVAPAGFEYLPLSTVQSKVVQELNASCGSGDFLAAKNLARSGHPVALVISSAGSGYNSNRDDFVQGLMHQVGVDLGAATRSALPDGRRLISFTNSPVSGAISGCYALVVEAGDARVARAVASVVR